MMFFPRKHSLFLCLFISVFFFIPVEATEKKQSGTTDLYLLALEKKAPFESPDILDYEKREAPTYRFQLSPYGGDYFADKFSHSFIVGGNFQLSLSPFVAFAIDGAYSQLSIDSSSLLGASISNKDSLFLDGAFVLTYPAAYRTRKSLVEMDFFTSLGGGVIRINNSYRGSGFIGGGIIIRPKLKWLGFRTEVRTHFGSISNPSGSDFFTDVSIRLGPAFFFPPLF